MLSYVTKMPKTSFLHLALRQFLRILAVIAPPLAAIAAARLFRNAPPRRLPVAPTTFTVDVNGETVHASVTEGEGPAILLAHGWGGWPEQLDGFAAPLRAQGYRVVTVSAVGHGRSTGRVSSLIEFWQSIAAVSEKVGGVQAIIAHSIAGAAAGLAVANGLATERLVIISAPSHPSRVFHRFLDWVGYSPRMKQRAFERVERDLAFSWSDLEVETWGPRIAIPLLLIHDAADREIPYQESVDTAAVVPSAHLITTRGLGHRRILEDAEVIRAVVGFVTNADVAAQVS